MIKRILLPLLLAVFISTAFGSTAYAQTDSPGGRNDADATDGADPARRGRRAARGEISAVDAAAGTFGLVLRNGETATVATDEHTRYHGEVSDLGDLRPGMQAGVVVRPVPGRLPVALVVAVPPEGLALRRYVGEIAGVNPASDSFTLESPENGVINFEVRDHTRFIGEVRSLEDLEPGYQAVVAAHTADDGSLIAVVVGVGQKQRIKRFAGEILSVDVAALAFDLQTLKGDRVKILVDAETQFRSADGSVAGIGDLTPGMQVGLGAIFEGDRQLLAKVVVVGRGLWDQLDFRARGSIISLQPGSFTMLTRGDREVRVTVDEATKFLSRDGSVQGFEDLAVGMPIAVGAFQLDSGELLAKVVAAVSADPSE